MQRKKQRKYLVLEKFFSVRGMHFTGKRINHLKSKTWKKSENERPDPARRITGTAHQALLLALPLRRLSEQPELETDCTQSRILARERDG